MIIQTPTIYEVDELHSLTRELGYHLKKSVFSDQLIHVLNNPNHFFYIANDNDKILGFIHGEFMQRLTSTPFVEIVALIVKSSHRGKGIGTKLVEHLNVKSNSKNLRVRCNITRNEAHTFYLNQGFEKVKEQLVFQRWICEY